MSKKPVPNVCVCDCVCIYIHTYIVCIHIQAVTEKTLEKRTNLQELKDQRTYF